jgi:phosphoribosylformylglycinamidine synthase
MIWEVEIRPAIGEVDREGLRLVEDANAYQCTSITHISTARVYLLETDVDQLTLEKIARDLLVDPVADRFTCHVISESQKTGVASTPGLINVLYRPGMTDTTAETILSELHRNNHPVEAVATCRRFWLPAAAQPEHIKRFAQKVLANEAIERIIYHDLKLQTLKLGHEYDLKVTTVPIRDVSDETLIKISQDGTLSLSLVEMHSVKAYFVELGRDPTDIELETIAQTWSEHCSHKTLAGRIRYQHGSEVREFKNMLKETIFAATMQIRKQLGDKDWCVSVFQDNAGVVTFNENFDVCIKVETHNRPSAIEPYGGANTGLGGVIRDSLGTGLGAKPVCSTDVFCFAPFDIPHDQLPKGVLHPRTVAHGVVAGVRDYGNRMGIPTVNGAVFFDPRYLGNPLVFCGNVALLPRDKTWKKANPGDYVVSIGGRTGLDGIHGATFSSAVLTEDSEDVSGGAVQIGNAITEKMVLDAMMTARDKGLYSAVTDCGAGGFSSAVGEMGAEIGAEIWLDQAPLKYSGLSYVDIWISESQERMVLAVPPENWEEFKAICEQEQVEASILGKFTDTKNLVLKYKDTVVGELTMEFMHDGRPPIVREAKFVPRPVTPANIGCVTDPKKSLLEILAAPSVASKEWIIRQYDHEVLAGSVVKPLVGVHSDGPADAAVVQPDLQSSRGIVVSNGMNPQYGDLDPYWMAASAIDEAIRNCVAVGADPDKIAILDNFCWGNTNDPECLGDLVRTSVACQDMALAYGTPFVSGKDSLHNEFRYDDRGTPRKIRIPGTLLISALGQMDDVTHAVTMDLKSAGNALYLIGETRDELGGSHLNLVHQLTGGQTPIVDPVKALASYRVIYQAINKQMIRSCHDLSEGGLAIALAEMAFAGELGANISLAILQAKTNLTGTTLLFSESNSRFVVEVPVKYTAEFENMCQSISFTKIGEVVTDQKLVITNAQHAVCLEADLATLKSAWKNGIQF